jgi:peptide deformylase
MIKTLKIAGGLGLSANQVGSALSIFVFKEGEDFSVAINPVLSTIKNFISVQEEGCLSLPGLRAKIPRYGQTAISFNDLGGILHMRQDEGLMAQVFQHEMDHLAGKLMWDNISSLNRDILKRKYKKFRRR